MIKFTVLFVLTRLFSSTWKHVFFSFIYRVEVRLHNHITPREEKYQVYMHHIKAPDIKKMFGQQKYISVLLKIYKFVTVLVDDMNLCQNLVSFIKGWETTLYDKLTIDFRFVFLTQVWNLKISIYFCKGFLICGLFLK